MDICNLLKKGYIWNFNTKVMWYLIFIKYNFLYQSLFLIFCCLKYQTFMNLICVGILHHLSGKINLFVANIKLQPARKEQMFWSWLSRLLETNCVLNRKVPSFQGSYQPNVGTRGCQDELPRRWSRYKCFLLAQLTLIKLHIFISLILNYIEMSII